MPAKSTTLVACALLAVNVTQRTQRYESVVTTEYIKIYVMHNDLIQNTLEVPSWATTSEIFCQ